MPISIAIDGPAGAGKSTISKEVAKRKNYTYLDTGAMYRACAFKAIKSGIDCNDAEKVSEMIADTKIDITFENGSQQVWVDNENVTLFLRTPEVTKGSSDISAIKSVRIKMVELQRDIAKGKDVIIDGRDIGTFVLPDADVKIFLTASPEERAKRRYLEIIRKGDIIRLEEVRKDIEYRDRNDSNRDFAPLKKAKDAIELDTTSKTIEEVVNEILAVIDREC